MPQVQNLKIEGLGLRWGGIVFFAINAKIQGLGRVGGCLTLLF